MLKTRLELSPEHRRRLALRVGLPVLGGVASLLLVALVWLPGLAEEKIRARLAPMGLSFEAGSVHVGLAGVSVGDLIVTSQGRSVLKARKLVADVALFGGRLRALRVEECTLQLDLAVLKLLRQRRAAAPGQGAPGAGGATLPELRWTQCALLLSDGQGAFGTLQGVEAQLAAGKLEATAKSATLGALPGEVVEASGIVLSGEVKERSLRLSLLSAEQATLRWSTDGSSAGADGLARGRTLQRIKKWRSELQGEPAEPGAPTATGNDAGRFSDNAKIAVKKVSVLAKDPAGGESVLLDELQFSARAQGSNAWLLTGKGVIRSDPTSEGSLDWDLRLAPRELKVEGRIQLTEVALSLFAPVLPPLPFHQLDRTRVKADLQISGTGLSAASVKGDLAIRDLRFLSVGLAEGEVGPISFSAHGQALWTPALRELSAIQGELRTGKAKAMLSGSLAWPVDGYRVDLLAELPRVTCREALAAVPAGLLGDLSASELSGDIAGKLTVHVAADALDDTKVDFDIDDKCRFGAMPELLDLQRFERPFVHTVFEPDGTVFEMETGPGSANWAPIDLISPFMTQGAIAHEDGRFLSHHGFAESEIANALARNLKARAFRFGASTITMQLVKNLFLHRDKLLSRKVQEAFIVWYLEQHWDKRRILELYLNVIEYGPSIYGIRNASMHYFGTIPTYLTPAQAGFFACILPNPKLYHDQYEKGALSESMKTRVTRFLQHMASKQRIDEEALAFGLEELKAFKFYDPSKPPPLPQTVRGNAQPLPFVRQGGDLDSWDLSPDESGSF